MKVKENSSIPNELCYWITFLTKVLPLRSIKTFIEQLIGAVLDLKDCTNTMAPALKILLSEVLFY